MLAEVPDIRYHRCMIGTKLCHRCGIIKPLDDFHKCSAREDGRQTQCKKCTAELNAAYYAAHKERHSQRRAKYYRENRERVLAKGREWAQANKERVRERSKKYYQEHKAQYNELKKRWNKENREKVNEWARRARLNPVKREKANLLKVVRRVFDHKGLGKSPITESVCQCTPMELYQHLCSTWEKNYGVKYNGEPCEIDHIVPLNTATTIEKVHKLYHYTNLQLLTRKDNQAKGTTISTNQTA